MTGTFIPMVFSSGLLALLSLDFLNKSFLGFKERCTINYRLRILREQLCNNYRDLETLRKKLAEKKNLPDYLQQEADRLEESCLEIGTRLLEWKTFPEQFNLQEQIRLRWDFIVYDVSPILQKCQRFLRFLEEKGMIDWWIPTLKMQLDLAQKQHSIEHGGPLDNALVLLNFIRSRNDFFEEAECAWEDRYRAGWSQAGDTPTWEHIQMLIPQLTELALQSKNAAA